MWYRRERGGGALSEWYQLEVAVSRLLALAQTTFNIGGDVGVVVAVLDEVRGALDAGDYVAADRMLSASRARQRRAAGLAALVPHGGAERGGPECRAAVHG